MTEEKMGTLEEIGKHLAEELPEDKFEQSMKCGGVINKLPCDHPECPYFAFCSSFWKRGDRNGAKQKD